MELDVIMKLLKGGLIAGGAILLGREIARRVAPADLQGQTALVTGGSRGLGLLICRELAELGCKLAICARDEAELDRARADLARAGAPAETLVCDGADREQVAHLGAPLTARLG